MPRTVDYYFTLASPWAFLGHQAFLDLATAQGVTIRYRPVDVGDVFPHTGGLPLPKRHPARQRYRILELQRWREARGIALKLNPKHWPLPIALPDRTVIECSQSTELKGRRGRFRGSTTSTIRMSQFVDENTNDIPDVSSSEGLFADGDLLVRAVCRAIPTKPDPGFITDPDTGIAPDVVERSGCTVRAKGFEITITRDIFLEYVVLNDRYGAMQEL
jgi:hypothetical protein